MGGPDVPDHCYTHTQPAADSTVTDNSWFNCDTLATTTDVMNDELSSIKNRSSVYSIIVYQNSNYGGASSTFGANVWDPVLSNNAIGDNRMSSYISP